MQLPFVMDLDSFMLVEWTSKTLHLLLFRQSSTSAGEGTEALQGKVKNRYMKMHNERHGLNSE